MSTAGVIFERSKHLPDSLQSEVFDFVDRRLKRTR
jgi:hypothetical protein